MAYDYTDINKSTSSPGIASTIWIMALANFQTFGGINTLNATTPGATVIIDEDHVPIAGEGFIKMYSTQSFSDMVGESIGDADSRSMKITVNAFSPGLSEVQAEFVKNALVEEGFVLLVKDADCSEGKVYQIGTHCSPAEIIPSFETGNKDGGKKGWTMKFEATMPTLLYYSGDIPEKM